MKRYVLFAAPTLLVLLGLLFWSMQRAPTDAPQAVQTLTIPKTQTIIEEEPKAVEVPPKVESNPIEATQITDASNTRTVAIENTEDEDEMDTSVKISDTEFSNFISDHLNKNASMWLEPEQPLSKLVRAINFIEEGKLVSKYRPLKMPEQSFRVDKQDKLIRISPTNYSRYSPYISTLETIGEDALLKTYNHFYPSMEQAYQELGVNKGTFRTVTKNALKQILNTPELPTAPLLIHSSVMYKYQDPQLEKLTAVQKLMIRMGPENSKRLKQLVKKIIDKI